MTTEWSESQKFEKGWWNDCTNTFGEEAKQITYAHRMGLTVVPYKGWWPVYDLKEAQVFDIGGGPVSLLLKCINRGRSSVVDPCDYPPWVDARYAAADIAFVQIAAEELAPVERYHHYDECWIYNVLQHVQDPEKVINQAVRCAPVLRIFEWIDIPAYEGHPHELQAELLDEWIGGKGTTENVNENGAVGRAYYGVFGQSSDTVSP